MSIERHLESIAASLARIADHLDGDVAQAPKAEPEPPAEKPKGVTLAEVRTLLSENLDRKQTVALLKEFGAKRLRDVPEPDLPALLKRAVELEEANAA